jgi:replicative DNA helicase
MVGDDAVCSCRVISTGSPQLDTLLSGLFPGDNIVMAGGQP